jgi:hypothetical protein
MMLVRMVCMIECPRCGKDCKSYKGYGCHHGHKHGEPHPLIDLVGRDEFVELYENNHALELAEELPCSRDAINAAAEELDIKRTQSEAEKMKNEQMSKEERREQTSAARAAHREKYDGGSAIEEWREGLTDEELRQHAREAGAKAAPARDENGMKGVTGQDHPNWRGGKDIYDAVKRQMPGASWNVIKERHKADECQNCGTSENLELHHIIPLMDGGTHEPWNLMTLCMSCHHKAEWFTRSFSSPVLTDK